MKPDLELVRQPPGSNTCGQCCVAMVSNISRLRSIQVFGTAGKTSWKQVRSALRRLSIKHSEVRREIMGLSVERAIVRVKMGKGQSHYVVRSFGAWWCPDTGVDDNARPKAWPPEAGVTSWVEIY